MNDEIKRLQYDLHQWALTGGAGSWKPGLLREAAALIERLEQERSRLLACIERMRVAALQDDWHEFDAAIDAARKREGA